MRLNIFPNCIWKLFFTGLMSYNTRKNFDLLKYIDIRRQLLRTFVRNKIKLTKLELTLVRKTESRKLHICWTALKVLILIQCFHMLWMNARLLYFFVLFLCFFNQLSTAKTFILYVHIKIIRVLILCFIF